MSNSKPNTAEATSKQRQKALSRWDDEGGANPVEAQVATPEMTNAELAHLRIRVIALENLLIKLLTEGPDGQLEVAREMAASISPHSPHSPRSPQSGLTLQTGLGKQLIGDA